MIQPKDDAPVPTLYSIGGVGRIVQFAETGDGRFLIALAGVSRFRLVEELLVDTPYRQARVSYDAFAGDRVDNEPLSSAERAAIESGLKTYLDTQGLSADWDAIGSADDESLVNTLATVCPFDSAEKQALLEAADVRARAATLGALMAFAEPESGHPTLH
jgi:Lon protease-like protein